MDRIKSFSKIPRVPIYHHGPVIVGKPSLAKKGGNSLERKIFVKQPPVSHKFMFH